MIKLLDFAPFDQTGEPTVRLLPKSSSHGVKIASSGAFAPEIVNFISSLKPTLNKLYALINAMGASEFFSCNRNGDAFYEDALKKYHPTFVSKGHPYMHHINKDPNKAYGKVVFSAYNDLMHRVELIVEYDTTKLDQKFVEKINNGEMVNVSMGCKVDADYCSICGNRAKTPADYCEHLTSNPGLNRMLPDGRKAFAINRDPEFFDISIVTIPADPTARVLAKLANHSGSMASSVVRAEESGLTKIAVATETKVDLSPSQVTNMNGDIGSAIMSLINKFDSAMGADMPSGMLNRIGGLSCNPAEILNGFIKKKVYLRPHEVQRIVLVSMGNRDLADKLESKKQIVLESPEEGMSSLLNSGSIMSGCDMMGEAAGARELSPDNIKKITIRITVPGMDKHAGVVSVPMSSDFKYLLGREDIKSNAPNMLSNPMDALKTYLVLGSLVAAFSTAMGRSISPGLLGKAGLISAISGPSLLDSIRTVPASVNSPVEEMTFMNPDSPEAVEAALMDALMKVNGRLNKQASFERFAPKALLSVPLAYGASKLINNEAKKSAIEDSRFTGKYEPGLLSRPELAFPLSLALLMKFASAEKKATSYIKSASKAMGREFFSSYSDLENKLSNILFN